MNWKVFNRDNPDTWPEVDCLFFVYNDEDILAVCNWDPVLKCFYDLNGFAEYWECFYVSVGYLPYIEKELHPIKCMKEHFLCEHEDDGYCLCKTECKYKREATEYSIGHKRIWKEFYTT